MAPLHYAAKSEQRKERVKYFSKTERGELKLTGKRSDDGYEQQSRCGARAHGAGRLRIPTVAIGLPLPV